MTVRNLLGGATLAVAATLLSVGGAYAQTSPLASGGSVNPLVNSSSTLLAGYTLVTPELTSAFSGTGGLAGNLVSAIYRNNTNSTLAFFYQLDVTGGTVTSFNISSFGGTTTSVAQASDDPDGTGPLVAGTVAVTQDTRSNDGSTIQFNLQSNIAAGQNSYSQFVVTNALTYVTSGTAGILGTNATFAAASGAVAAPLTPTVAPEPGSLALAATGMLGMLGMVGVRRRRGSLAA